MPFRNTMILGLVFCVLVGWVRSQQDAAAPDDRDKREHMKRRLIERLTLRGFKGRERDRLAEELWSRIEPHIATSTTTPTSRHQRDHHRSLQRHNSRMIQDAPYPEATSYAQVYPQLEVLQEEAALETLEEEVEQVEEAEEVPEFEQVALDLKATFDYLPGLLMREVLPDKLLERRHAAEIIPEQTTRRTREERRREKEEKRRRREEKKRKRANKKNKQRKRNREFELFLRNQSIPIHDVDGERFFDCCPSKLVVVEMVVGKRNDFHAMEVMGEHRTFYERVCLEEYLGKECIFPARSLKKGVVTRCAQEISYSQAFIRPYESSGEFKIGFVQVRSGCSCQVSLTHKKKKKRKR